MQATFSSKTNSVDILPGKRTFVSGTTTTETMVKVGKVCMECLKGGGMVILGLEGAAKLAKGSPLAVSPWRENLLNYHFPEDKTKVWTELKAAKAWHAKAMGHPHESIYEENPILKSAKTLEEFKDSFPKQK
jgi:hypothetical protein